MTPTQIAAKPADKRTPIEQAILDIDSHKSIVGTDPKTALDYAVWKLQALLPAEREQIELAYEQGDDDSSEEQHGGHWSRKHKGSTDYFTKTYAE